MKNIFQEIISRRSLLRELIAKDLRARYRRPVLSFLWAFLSPLFFSVILYVIFSVFMKIEIKEANFLLYLMTAVFTWRFFQEAVSSAATCLMDNRNLIKEANFPHYLIPLSLVIANLLNFLPSLAILVFFTLFILKGVPLFIIFLPAVLLMHCMITFGLALIACLAYIRWRDTKYMLEILLQALFYLTPVFYSLSLVRQALSQKAYCLYLWNPFVAILSFYRLTLLKGFYQAIKLDVHWFAWAVTMPLIAVAVMVIGFIFYFKNRKYINDYLAY
ncbi:MAG: ABC transporter permease [Candidatus Omnitrophica bacterium]|nr:ABC transporter permease [Candidatus Omnitrophota bacterium]MDD5652592.1 ABC transporter permease [Candidatus Omnitrophota bacterium]